MGRRARALETVVRRPDPAFWAGKNVLVTGHTGFKGAWAARMLALMGARVTGFALDPLSGPSAFGPLGVAADLARDVRADLRDAEAVQRAVHGADIVLHLAAQAIVSEGYRDPVQTWASNVTGTLHLLQSLRGAGVQSAVMVTTDKVYQNTLTRAFVESDPLGGDDPYSASKVACEILVASHCASFADLPPMATARAGNVIGGGDFGLGRLIPDLIRAQIAGQPLILRNPDATRPFQHVLDVISGYLLLAEKLATGQTCPPAVNFGPEAAEISVRDLLAAWGAATGAAPNWQTMDSPPMIEKPRLALDSALARLSLHWSARLTTHQAIAATAAWYGAWAAGQDMAAATDTAIQTYLEI